LWGNFLWREVISQAKREINGFQAAEHIIVTNSFINSFKNEDNLGNLQYNKNSLQSISEVSAFENIDEQTTNDENHQPDNVYVVKEV
jgi:hypothetical protein